MQKTSSIKIFGFLTTLALVTMILSLLTGTSEVSLADFANIFSGQADTTQSRIILDIRLPRTLTAFLTGGLLALSGVLMQVLLRNPLADPYILGISGGAASGALLAITLGFSVSWTNTSAFVGALFSMLLVYILSRNGHREHGQQLLLTGVILAAGWGAVINLLLILADAQNIHSMLFWLMGDLSMTDFPHAGNFLLLFTALLISWLLARDLNLLSHGENKAATLGSPVGLIRKLVFVIAAICTAVAVSMAGTIGFVGLVIPHLMRMLTGSDHRILLPAAVLAGGSLLVAADLGARTILSPLQLPVGVITAFIGVPIFIYLLKHRHH